MASRIRSGIGLILASWLVLSAAAQTPVPSAAGQPARAVQPAVTNQPARVNQSPATSQPAPAVQPASTNQPATANQPPTTSQPAAATTQPGHYRLRVKADRTYLRCGPDRNSVAVMEVDAGTTLAGAGQQYGWQRVEPPKGVFYFVAAEFVDEVAPGRGVVSVRSGRLRVRVGSLVTDVDPAKSEVKLLLERGAEVRTLGRQGEWLKIVPPEGIYLYVPDDFVEVIGPGDIAGSGGTVADGQGAAGPASAPASRPTSAPYLGGEWGQRLVLVEAAIEAEGRKPALDQSWTTIIVRLRPIGEQRAEPVVARLAQEWITRLEQREADQAVLRAARPVSEREAQDRAQFDREMERIRRARQVPESQSSFLARGQLVESVALRADDRGPRYKLQDPVSGKVLAYLEPAAGAQVPFQRLVRRYVGVRGESRFDQKLGTNVIAVAELEAIPWETPASGPARETP